MFQIQRLIDRRTDQPSVRHAAIGRAWQTLATVDRLTTAEMVAKGARVDGGFVRIRLANASMSQDARRHAGNAR